MSSNARNNSTEKLSDFGRRLKEVFGNISNQSIAEKLSVSKPALTAYVQGRIPPPDKLIEIAKLTKCNLNWLLTGEGTKENTPQIERPQGIILQGTKGGIGTSVSAVLIAANLALRGYGVLIAADEFNTCSHLLLANHITDSDEARTSSDELYIRTGHKNLDFFIPGYWRYEYPRELTNKFIFDYEEINKRYQFVIFDVQKTLEPFNYPHYNLANTSIIEPILRNAQVLMPYHPCDSVISNLKWTLRKVELQKKIYPAADFMGTFITHRWGKAKRKQARFIEDMDELRGVDGAKLFKTEIEYQNGLSELRCKEFEKKLFSRKTGFFQNYSLLVDEMLEKLNAGSYKARSQK
jgi:cellulose biosynthesis protein BcsQ